MGAALLAFLCGGLGYLLRVVQEELARRRHERALHALGGNLPDWEMRARELEAHAQRQSLVGKYYHARTMRAHADQERARGRRRDRMWS